MTIAEISLGPFERGVIFSIFLETLASAWFLFMFAAFFADVPSTIVETLGNSDGSIKSTILGVVVATAVFIAFVALALLWPWALARMWRSVIVCYSSIVGLSIMLAAPVLVVLGLQAGDVTGGPAVVLIIVPVLFGWRIFVDGIRRGLVASGNRRFFTFARPGLAGLGDVFAAAFGVPQICRWIAPVWRGLVARGLFALAGFARFVMISFVIICCAVLFALNPGQAFGGVMLTLVLGLPMTALLRYVARRFARISVENLVHIDERAPILFLRSFKDDQVQLPQRSGGWIRGLLAVGEPKPTVDNVLLDEATPLGPVVAIGLPGAPPPFGAARTFVSNAEWQDEVAKLAKAARAIVIVLDDTEGIQWELAHIEHAEYESKTLYLLPPKLNSPDSFRKLLQRHVFFEDKNQIAAHADRLIRASVGWFRTDRNGLVLLTSKKATAASYVSAVRLFRAYQLERYVPSVVALGASR